MVTWGESDIVCSFFTIQSIAYYPYGFKSYFCYTIISMRYAFVFLAIVAMWVALLLLALKTTVDTLFLATVVMVLTVVLFLIGFQRGR